jgi:hypothetical protein
MMRTNPLGRGEATNDGIFVLRVCGTGGSRCTRAENVAAVGTGDKPGAFAGFESEVGRIIAGTDDFAVYWGALGEGRHCRDEGDEDDDDRMHFRLGIDLLNKKNRDADAAEELLLR